jgi:hypothetical protein
MITNGSDIVGYLFCGKADTNGIKVSVASENVVTLEDSSFGYGEIIGGQL